MKKYIKIDWPDSQSILEYSKNVYNINDSQSIFIDENEYNIIKEYIKLDKYLKTLKDKDILYVEDKYKNNWIIVFKEYKNHEIHSYYSYYINDNEHINSQGGVFASLREIRLITIANDEHLKQIKDDKYLKLYLNKEESFKDGDILTYMFCNKPSIYIYRKNGGYNTSYYVAYSSTNEKFYNIPTGALAENRNDLRFATEEEKQKLFQVIKDNGYKWNDETKSLEKLIVPKFNVGDRVKKNKDYISGIVTDIFDDSFKVTYDSGGCCYVQFHYQCDWELVPNKFDINTLKEFDKVLVRDNDGQKWIIDFFGFMDKDKGCPFVLVGHYISQCIPYEQNKHLLNTINDCSSFFKTWEK